MGRVFKWVGISLAGLLVLLVAALLILSLMTRSRLNKTYDFSVEPLAVSQSADAVTHGEHLATIHCKSCHGPDLTGSVIFNDPMLATISAPNITGGYGLSGGALSDEQLIQAIRHGLNSENKPLIVMASLAFYNMSDQDLGDLLAYLKSTPHQPSEPLETRMTFIGQALTTVGAFGNIIHAESIDHTAPRPQVVQPSVSVEYGKYMVDSSGCWECHGEDLTGGKSPNPDSPPAHDLTAAGNVGSWSAEEFITTMRTGTTPDGRHLSPFMAWQWYGQMTDDELTAVWMYLRGLPGATASN